MKAAHDRVRALRAQARGWIGLTFHTELLDVFGATPATEIAFHWLQTD
jgi:hypothetical protein